MAEIRDAETVFLHTSGYNGGDFRYESVFYVRTHFKPTETFQYTHFLCHPP